MGNPWAPMAHPWRPMRVDERPRETNEEPMGAHGTTEDLWVVRELQ